MLRDARALQQFAAARHGCVVALVGIEDRKGQVGYATLAAVRVVPRQAVTVLVAPHSRYIELIRSEAGRSILACDACVRAESLN